jgi:hypothetical protein
MIFLNTKFKLLFLILLSHLFSETASSQNLVFDNIKSINLSNQSVIKNGEDIVGYFFISENDTIDNYANTYKLTISDKKLKVIKETEIKVPQESSIFETSCNGSEIVLSFLDFDTKTFDYQIYDLNGVKKFSYTRKLKRKEFKLYSKPILKENDEDDIKSFYPIDGVGFIYNTMKTGKDLNSISVNFYGTKENKQWSYEPTIAATYFIWEYFGIYKDVVYIYIYSFKGSIYLDKPEVFIVGLDIKNGVELFKKPAEAKYKIVAKGIKTLNDGTGYLYGTYYYPNANLAKDKADGLALWKITEDGNLIDEKYVSLKNDLGKFLNVTNNGKILGTGNIYLHNIILSDNGNIYILCEGYGKVVNAFTVAYGALFGLISTIGMSYTKDVATDMILIKLDSVCKTQDVILFDKKNSNFFGYNNTLTNKASNSFSFWYFTNKANVVNSINVNNDKVTTDKIRINVKTSRSLVLPASNGQILLIEYFRSAKKMEANFKAALN